jgi:hypothetical protein
VVYSPTVPKKKFLRPTGSKLLKALFKW